jgi:hypothetical protein
MSGGGCVFRSGVRYEPDFVPVDLRVDKPSPARMYDYFLGGKDNFPADREAAEQVLKIFPEVRTGAVENRGFLQRAARFVAAVGTDQFVDVGTGLPTSPNLHEVVQAVNPAGRVVYVDNDPLVLVHARALLTGTPEGRTVYVDADLRDPRKILAEAFGDVIDVSRPVALSLVAVLHFLPDKDDPAGIVRRLVEPLAVGSSLLLSHATGDFAPREAAAVQAAYAARGISLRLRTRAEITALVPAGMQIGAPGVVPVHRWLPEDEAKPLVEDADVGVFGLLARKG